MHLPLVSVVMSVRNGGIKLNETIQSVLEQECIDFELILIDDGSTDDTRRVLTGFAARDPRIRLLIRDGRGLTISLIEGCKEARGQFIARQDAYDYSMPGRLRSQADILQAEPTASMCSSHVRFITEEKVTLPIQTHTESVAREGLSGIIHGSTMFRKSDYVKVGGYRKEFYYAQDVDLWSRLVEVGHHIIIPKILYENCIYPGSISGSRKKEQTTLHSFIVGATQARKVGRNEDKWLAKASYFSEKYRIASRKRINNSSGAYFIVACLLNKHPVLAKKYLQMSLQSNPLNLRARLKILNLR
jgi:glycosyltransferase involved in cell wall biosynthesis